MQHQGKGLVHAEPTLAELGELLPVRLRTGTFKTCGALDAVRGMGRLASVACRSQGRGWPSLRVRACLCNEHIRGCSQIMSAKNGGFRPPSTLCPPLSAFPQPPLPPLSAIVSIWQPPLSQFVTFLSTWIETLCKKLSFVLQKKLQIC